MAPSTTIERIGAGDAAAFARFERAGEPVVIERGVAEWPAVERWTPAYLAGKLGDVEIGFKISTTGAHPNFHEPTLAAMFATGRAPFREFLAAITTGEPAERARRLFTGDEQFLIRRRDGVTTIAESLRPLLDDIATPSFVPADRLYTVWSWFSGRGARTWLHYDNNGCHNLNAQITGAKECVLFAPDQLARLAPFPLGGGNPAHNCSQIDVDHVDAARFPEFAHAEGVRARLEPGDLLFIPAWWFHAFVHLGEFNSNVNFWWKPEAAIANAVATRQALIDLAAAAKIDAKTDAAAASLLQRLDRAAIAQGS